MIRNTDTDELWRLWRPTFVQIRDMVPHADPAEIEDLTGETILRVLRSDKALDGHPNALLQWVLTVARNLVFDRSRRLKLRRYVPLDAAERERGRLDAGSDRHADVLDLCAALGTLPDRERRLLVSAAEGRSHDEVAALHGTTRLAVKSNNHRTYTRLRVAMGVTA